MKQPAKRINEGGASDGIIELMCDACAGLGVFRAQRMFGGHGLWLDDFFFAILIDGTLYFKVSDATRSRYEAEGMQPFSYETKAGRRVLTSCWRIPERLYDDSDEMPHWIREAVAAARDKKKPQRKSTARRRERRRGQGG